LVALLDDHGVPASGGTEDRGAFVVVRDPRARAWSAGLRTQGVITDARGDWLRLCPDVLTTDEELVRAAACVGKVARELA
jgi:kynureninase